MNRIQLTLLILIVTALAGFVGFFIGSEAKQKWVSKLKNRYDDRRQLSKKQSIIHKGGVLLDDIELEAYHN